MDGNKVRSVVRNIDATHSPEARPLSCPAARCALTVLNERLPLLAPAS
jgi:hypothetical protein